MSEREIRTTAPRALERTLGRLRRRSLTLIILRALLAFFAGAGALLLALGLALGPIVSPLVAAIALAICAGGGIALAFYLIRPHLDLSHERVAMLLERAEPGLGRDARSAYELLRSNDESNAFSSDALREAHLRELEARLEAIRGEPLLRAVPALPALIKPLVAALLVGAVALFAYQLDGDLKAGALALFRAPFHTTDDIATGEIVRRYSVDVEPPEYRGGTIRRGLESATIEAFEGSMLHFTIEPRVEAEELIILFDEQRIALEPDRFGIFEATHRLERGGRLVIRLKTPRGEWVEDLRGRAIRAIPDPLPSVSLAELHRDEELRRLLLRFEAEDDHEIASLDLIVSIEGLSESRRSLEDGRPAESVKRGIETLDLRELGAEPGDRVSVSLEARDRGRPPEARVVRSEPLHYEIPSPESERRQNLNKIDAALGRVLDALADRLDVERVHPVDDAREQRIIQSTSAVFPALREIHEAISKADRPLLERFERELRKEAQFEAEILARRSPPRVPLERAEARITKELEEGALLLDDLRAKARVEDFQEIALELEELRREIASLLAEWARTDHPETKQALLRAIVRAERKLEALRSRMAESGLDLPQEFINQGEQPSLTSAEELMSLREAVESGTIEDAEASLLALERELHALTNAFTKEEGEALGGSRFSPRQRALAEAIEAVRGLEAEAQELARKHLAIRRDIAERALEKLHKGSSRVELEALKPEMEAAKEAADELKRASPSASDSDQIARIAGRIDDVIAALESGDIAEAAEMAGEAQAEAVGFYRDLALRAAMFPGRRGEVRDAEVVAERVAEAAMKLRASVDSALPDIGGAMQPSERKQLEELARRHRAVSEVAERVEGNLREGPDGAPLSEEAAATLRAATEHVNESAERASERDPIASSDSAAMARESLRKTREILEDYQRNPSPSSGDGGGSSGGGGGAEGRSRAPSERVEIPGESRAPEDERRRRIRDGLREQSHPDYREAVRRYYEELLR